MDDISLPITWKTMSLSEIAAEFVNGGTPSTKVPEYWSGHIPWITGADIKNFRARADGDPQIKEELTGDFSRGMKKEV